MEMTVPAQVKAAERAQAALVITPHPLTLQDQRVYMDGAGLLLPGETLAAFLERHGVLPGQQWVVTVGGVLVHEMHWPRVKPKPGHLIEARRVPERDVLRIVALVALTVFTAGIGNVWLRAAVQIAGSLVINKVLAPKAAARPENSNTSSPTYSITAGGRNQARQFQPMGLVLGEPYAVPDMGAQPYTFIKDGEQHLFQIFHTGINCADAHSLRVGQTPLSNYTGVTVLRSGMASNNSTFPELGGSVDTVPGALLTAPSGMGPWVQRTSSANTVRLGIDLTAALFAVTNEGAYTSRGLDVGVEYRLVGSGTWLPATAAIAGVPAVTVERTGGDDSGEYTWLEVVTPAVAAVPAGVVRLSHASQQPLRRTIELDVPAGQYEVRLQKRTVDYTGTQGANQVEWGQLKSYQPDTGAYDGESRLAVQIQASNQLNGVLDELNAVLIAKPMPYWNGTAWVTATSRATGLCNPGAQLLMLARGIYSPTTGRLLAGMGLPDEEINIPSLQQFMVHCAAQGFEFDYFNQRGVAIGELMDIVAYAGMGEVGYPDGRLGVVFFTADDPLTGVINMASIKARSFSVSYETMPTADEVEVQYLNRITNVWASLRMLAPGVVNPRNTVTMPLDGVGTEQHAAALLRFVVAQNTFQLKTVTASMDLEYMTYKRGQVVSLSHDLTQWGYGGRLQACELLAGGTVRLTLDDSAPGTIPAGYSGRYIGLRLAGEEQMRVFPVREFAGQGRVLELDAPWPAGVPLPGATPDNPAHDTLWIYDFKATPGQLLRIISIEPSGDDAATLTMVPELPEFWDMVASGAYTAPPNNSLLPPAPSILSVLPAEQLARQGNTFYSDLSLSFEVAGNFNRAELWGAVGAGEVAPPLRFLAGGRSTTLNWRGGLDERWHLELRTFGDTRASAPFRLIYDVVGLRAKPADVQAVTVSGSQVAWPPVGALDLAGYKIRFNYGNDRWWDYAAPLHDGLVTDSPYQLERVPSGECTILVKAVDTTGNESETAAFAVYVFPEQPVANVLLSFAQHPTFGGTLTNGTRVSGQLQAVALDDFYSPPDAPMYLPSDDAMYLPSQYAEMVYEFSVQPAEVGTLLLQTTIVGAYRIEYAREDDARMYEPIGDPMYLPSDEPFYGTPSAFQLWPGSLAVDGEIAVRIRITVAGGADQGVVSAITAVLDVPDVVETLSAVTVASGGTRLPILRSYHSINAVVMTVHGGGSGVSARILDKSPTLGPLVQIINTSGTGVAGTLDALIQGF